MVLPPGHSQAVVALGRLTTREKRLVAGVLGLVAALVVVLVISLGAGEKASARGCIHVTIPGAVGAEEIDQCGGRARETCATARRTGSFTTSSARVVAAACRKAGLRVG
jgi:hypothetical protein